MTGSIAAICRHPIKGFTPERLSRVELEPGRRFPGDRIYAVENGPSGFDPATPVFIRKQKFTVLAAIPKLAQAQTEFDPDTGRLRAQAPDAAPFDGELATEAGRAAFADWLTAFLGESANGPLRVLTAGDTHAFTDHADGQISIINLESVRDLQTRLGKHLDPLRFRANLYVNGWPAWSERDWTGQSLVLGDADAKVFKPINRCAAIHVDPHTGEADLDLTKALFDHYGHTDCGIYVHVTVPGAVSVGDPCPQALP